MDEPDSQRFFRHDAFISYAHADNATGIVRALHAQLDEFLRSRLDWEPSVWLDERSLDTEGDLERQIREGLRDAAVLIVVASETVETRKWCRDEMSWFLTGASLERVAVTRLFPVYLPVVDRERLPRWAKDGSACDVFVLDSDRRELVAEQDYGAHREYWDPLYRFFSAVAEGIVAAHAAWGQLAKDVSPPGP